MLGGPDALRCSPSLACSTGCKLALPRSYGLPSLPLAGPARLGPQGAISPAGEKACRVLRALPPAEALGVMCWLMEELGASASAKQCQLAAQLLEDVSAFAAGMAKRSWARHEGEK